MKEVMRLRDQSRATAPLLSENPFREPNTPLPQDPVSFATFYWDACLQEQRYAEKPSLKLLERVTQVDPENGLWDYLTASVMAQQIDVSSGKWRPEDEETVSLVLLLHHRAAISPNFDSYGTALRSRMIGSLPPAKTVEDCFLNLSFTESYTRPDQHLSAMPYLLGAVVQKHANQKEIAAFNDLFSDWLTVTHRQAEGFNHLDDLIVMTSSFRWVLQAFLTASRDLNLDRKTQAIEASLKKLSEVAEPSQINNSNKRAYWLHGSNLLFISSPCSYMCSTRDVDYFRDRYPPMSFERLEPNRRSEHAYMAGFLTQVVEVMLLGALAGLFLIRFRHGRICRELSTSLTGLFDRSDWIHCLGIGVILPTAYFALIRYLSPFGGMDWFATPTRSLSWILGATAMDWIVGDNDLLLERARFLLLFLLIVSCSLLVLRRRLRTRTSFFETSARKGRIGVGLTIAGFVVLPLLGSCYRVEHDRYVRLDLTLLYPCLAVMGAMVIWMAALAFRFVFGNPEQALRRQILSRLVAHAMICSFALLGATIPLHMVEERFWVKQDTVLRADPDHPAQTRYEWEVIQLMKGELLEALAPLEEIRH